MSDTLTESEELRLWRAVMQHTKNLRDTNRGQLKGLERQARRIARLRAALSRVEGENKRHVAQLDAICRYADEHDGVWPWLSEILERAALRPFLPTEESPD